MLSFITLTILTLIPLLSGSVKLHIAAMIVYFALLLSLPFFKTWFLNSSRRFSEDPFGTIWADRVKMVGPTPERFRIYGGVATVLSFVAAFAAVSVMIAISELTENDQQMIFYDRILFLGCYAFAVAVYHLYPLLEFLLLRRSLYRKIKAACARSGYACQGSFLEFLLSGIGGKITRLDIETKSERFAVYPLGLPGSPRKYFFRQENEQVSYLAGYTTTDDNFERWQKNENITRRWLKSDGKSMKWIDFPGNAQALTENTQRILLFCPDGVIVEDVTGEKTIETGNTLYGYRVYDGRNFVRGRLGSRRE